MLGPFLTRGDQSYWSAGQGTDLDLTSSLTLAQAQGSPVADPLVPSLPCLHVLSARLNYSDDQPAPSSGAPCPAHRTQELPHKAASLFCTHLLPPPPLLAGSFSPGCSPSPIQLSKSCSGVTGSGPGLTPFQGCLTGTWVVLSSHPRPICCHSLAVSPYWSVSSSRADAFNGDFASFPHV